MQSVRLRHTDLHFSSLAAEEIAEQCEHVQKQVSIISCFWVSLFVHSANIMIHSVVQIDAGDWRG